MYVPSPFQIVQTAGHVVFLFERMAWRIVPTDGRAHLPDRIRLWQGDSVGRWDGDTLVVETTNLNGKTWLNEVGEIVSHAETCRRTVYAGGRGHDRLRGDGDRSDRLHAAVDHRASRSSARTASCSKSRVTRTTRICRG